MNEINATLRIAFSLAFVLLALLAWSNSIRSPKFSALAAFSVFTSLSLIGVFYVADRLSGNGIDQSVLFHLGVGLESAGFGDFKSLFALSAAIIVQILLITLVAYWRFLKKGDEGIRTLHIFVGAISIAASLVVNPASNDIIALSNTLSQGDQYDFANGPELFHQVDSISFGTENKNIVYLFLESVERTYLDETVFPGLMPRLAGLEQEALSFTNINQLSGTSWTIAGMTAALCGLPLNGFVGNSMSRMERFLPQATCLGDLLSEHGYDLHYIGGADLDFAGKGDFFRTHGFDSIEGRDELVPRLTDESYQSPWGLYDDSMYAFATERFDSLAGSDDPFALVLLTVDTHHPSGHQSQRCKGQVYGDGSNSMLNAVHCADLLLGDFVDHVRSSPAAEDTILVVASDHLAMPNMAWNRLTSIDRKNLLLFFASDMRPRRDDRPASTLDVGPTLLSLAGAKIDTFGFGRSLLTEDPTLTESLEDIDDELGTYAAFLASLWSFPGIDLGIRMDGASERLVLGRQTIGYPVLISLDADMQITALRFEFFADNPLHTQIEWLSHDEQFIWIDQCDLTAQLVGIGDGDPLSYCAALGALGSSELHHVEISDGEALPYPVIEGALTGQSGTEQSTADRRLALVKVLKRVGPEDVLTHRGQEALLGHYLIRSAGFGTGTSHVTNMLTDAEVVLARGITVVGMNERDTPVKLFHQDTCGWSEAIVEVPNFYPSIQKTLEGFTANFSSFAIVVDDSAVCSSPVDMRALFAGTPFQEWDQIDYRRPFIGLVMEDGSFEEFTGEPETALTLEAKDFLDDDTVLPVQRQSASLPRIAHAGGAADGVHYTNSFEALDQNRSHFDLFEIDFVWTSDDHLVCLHDWSGNFRASFNIDRDGPVTLNEFKRLTADARFRNCTLESLVDWLEANPGTRIVPDVKDRNTEAMHRIATLYPEHIDRFVAQIYQPDEYPLVRSMGFKDIIWTLYRYHPADREILILSWLRFMDIYGLAMPVETAMKGLAQQARRETGVLSWAHTVNSPTLFDELRARGVVEIMTEDLLLE
jgi:glycerophosphoryl diester phosphodiesterase